MQKVAAYAMLFGIFYGFYFKDLYGGLTFFVAALTTGTGLAISFGAEGTNLSKSEKLRKLQRIGGILSALGSLLGAIYGQLRWGWAFSISGFATGIGLMLLIGYILGSFERADSDPHPSKCNKDINLKSLGPLSREVENAPVKDTANASNERRKYEFALAAYQASAHPSPEIRAAAQQKVKTLFPGGLEGFDETMESMIKSLKSGDEQGVNLAITVLTGFGELSIPYLIPLLSCTDPEVRKLANFVLTLIHNEQKEILCRRNK